MACDFPVSIDSVVTLLGLLREPRYREGMASYNVRCPFCGDTKYHMNINTRKNAYNCFRCAGSKTGGGALDLYSRVALGIDHRPGKKKDGGNGDEIFAKLLDALHLGNPFSTSPLRNEPKRSVPSAPSRASDSALDRAYQALLAFPGFALTEDHRNNLLQRGLDDESINKNEYRSAGDFSWVDKEHYPMEVEAYQRFQLDSVFDRYDSLRHLPIKQRVAGLIVASELLSRNISLEGVPGFFYLPTNIGGKVKKIWFFRIETGLLIPTRNYQKQIVCLQARKDRGKLRYMTISSKGLPGGVEEGISRTHFPLANSPIGTGVAVYLTEGPLKADVAIHLMNRPACFVALHGVSNRNELPEIFQLLRENGVSILYNAFDMDKTTNPHVAAAGKVIRQMALTAGLKNEMMLWDEQYASRKYLELLSLCQYHGLSVRTEFENVFVGVAELADNLSRQGIRHSILLSRNGAEKKEYWSDATKGIDDYLLSSKTPTGN